MASTYLDLQEEVKHRATRDQAGTEFDTTTKRAINSALYRISREARWRPLRREDTFDTVAEYSTGTISATNGSSSFTASSVNLITNGIAVGRRISISGSNKTYIIRTITGENAFTTDKVYDGTTASGLTHTIYGQETYNLPMQTGRLAALYHEELGYPYRLIYVPTQAFLDSHTDIATSDTPTHYREWGQNNVIAQPLEGSVVSVSSSAAADTGKSITVFGIVSGYPDFETVNTDGSDGTTPAVGSKVFTKIERVTKDASTTGRITVTTNSANVIVSVLPVGDSTGSVELKKIQLWPLPTSVFPIHALYYKDPWRLVNDGDIHELGQDFDEAIILLASSKIALNSDKKEGQSLASLYSDELISLKRKNADKLDYIPTLKRPGQGRSRESLIHSNLSYSQLGGAFGPRVSP